DDGYGPAEHSDSDGNLVVVDQVRTLECVVQNIPIIEEIRVIAQDLDDRVPENIDRDVVQDVDVTDIHYDNVIKVVRHVLDIHIDQSLKERYRDRGRDLGLRLHGGNCSPYEQQRQKQCCRSNSHVCS